MEMFWWYSGYFAGEILHFHENTKKKHFNYNLAVSAFYLTDIWSQYGPKHLPMFLPSVVDRHRFDADQDPNSHLDDPDPDPDCHQNDFDPHADPFFMHKLNIRFFYF